MKSGFITALFVSLAVFGIWFQQSYMEVYSQEFELELKSDRTKAELLNMHDMVVHEYRTGARVSSFHAREARIHNNGRIYAGGNLRYVLYDEKTGKPSSEFTTSRLLGEMKTFSQGKSFFDTANRLDNLVFPAEVVGSSTMGDKIMAHNVRFEPGPGLFTSSEPVEWEGPGRRFSGRGFRYTLKRDELSIGGPLKGNFIPGKDDFKGFKATR